jgi:hypothetical protein
MGSTQPREYNWGATFKKKNGSGLEIQEYGRRDPSRWPRGTYIRKIWHYICRHVAIARSVQFARELRSLFLFFNPSKVKNLRTAGIYIVNASLMK